MKTTIALLLTAAGFLVACDEAAAAPRRWAYGHSAGVPRSGNPYGYRSATEIYPKYYGGFHYRALDNVGIPNGDIGLRGNGFTASPW
jgi:hypothetical protein